MTSLPPVSLAKRAVCTSPLHAYPWDPSMDGAERVKAAYLRLRAGWVARICATCGCGGWRPPSGPL